MKLAAARKIAESVFDKLAPHCTRIEIAGSIARCKPDVKDIEIVCIPKKRGTTILRDNKWHLAVHNLGNFVKGKRNLKAGKYFQINLPEGIKLDLFVAEPENWAMIHLIRIGSADYSKRIMQELNKRGYTSQGGRIVPKNLPEGVKPVDFEFTDESDIFDWLGLDYIPPFMRTANPQNAAAFQKYFKAFRNFRKHLTAAYNAGKCEKLAYHRAQNLMSEMNQFGFKNPEYRTLLENFLIHGQKNDWFDKLLIETSFDADDVTDAKSVTFLNSIYKITISDEKK